MSFIDTVRVLLYNLRQQCIVSLSDTSFFCSFTIFLMYCQDVVSCTTYVTSLNTDLIPSLCIFPLRQVSVIHKMLQFPIQRFKASNQMYVSSQNTAISSLNILFCIWYVLPSLRCHLCVVSSFNSTDRVASFWFLAGTQSFVCVSLPPCSSSSTSYLPSTTFVIP